MRSRGLKRDVFLSGNELQMFRDEVCRNTVEIKPLTATQNGGHTFWGSVVAKIKFHVLGRLFESL